jgi:hypothetical protein
MIIIILPEQKYERKEIINGTFGRVLIRANENES